jgi:hypothetical protein
LSLTAVNPKPNESDFPICRLFSISYEAARIMVLKAGNMVGIYLRPHDLRRHAVD